jgi:hypothetical protein
LQEQLVKSSAQIYGGTNRCTSITIHETANTSKGADAQAHANLQTNGNVRQASWHITVDETEAIRSYPDTAQCWHTGTREGAESSIAVEICVNSDGDYGAAFKNAAEVVASLRAKHEIPRSKVYDHAHWTGKDCPTVMRATGRWQEFLNLTNPSQKESIAMASTPAHAIAKSLTITKGYVGLCLVFVRTCFGIAAKYPTATAGWNNAAKKHPTSSTANIPAGVPIWFRVPGLSAGHVALYLGGGKCRMNVSHKGTVETVTVDWYLKFSKGTLLGWTEDINGVTVYTPPKSSAPKPAGKTVAQMAGEVIAGKHGNGHDNRRKSLGVSASVYEHVRDTVNGKAATKTVSQMATEVIAGKHGNGHPARQKSLGVTNAVYAKVRAEVNRRA